MEKRITGLNNLVLAGFTALLLLSGCATTPVAATSKNTTPQQLILQNRKDEAMQEFVMHTPPALKEYLHGPNSSSNAFSP